MRRLLYIALYHYTLIILKYDIMLQVYENLVPLHPDDVSDTVIYAVRFCCDYSVM
jgi:hypothetical protein